MSEKNVVPLHRETIHSKLNIKQNKSYYEKVFIRIGCNGTPGILQQ